MYAFFGVSSITCFDPVTVTGKRHSSCSSPESVACSHQLPGASVTAPCPCLSSRALIGADATVDASTKVHHLQVDLGSAEIAGWAVDLAATAGVTSDAAALGTGDTGLVVGGELAVSGLRFDAAYGEDAAFMGLDGTRMTAGVSYDLGPFDTRMSYSVVERETTVDTSLFTVGSRLSLKPGLVVQGDMAYADDENGDVSTAGRVSLQFNF